jgi:restriction endonuclease S subunit
MKRWISQIAEVKMGFPFRSRLEPDPAGEIAVIQMKDIDNANLLHPEDLIHVRMPDYKESHLVRKGDLLFRSRGFTNTASLVATNLQRTVLAAPMMLIRVHAEIITPSYLQWFINLPSTQATLAKKAEGTSVRMINKTALEALEVPVPPLVRQKEIVQLADLAAKEEQLTQELLRQRKRFIEGFLLRRARDPP